MTDTAARAEWRWALADEQARVLLAAPAPRRFSIALAAGALVGAVIAVVATALSFEPGSTGRWITSVVASLLGLALLLADAVRTRWTPHRRMMLQPVTRSLSPRERFAVHRVIRRREDAPEDRLDVIRAAALQTAGGVTLPSVGAQLLLVTGIATSGVTLAPVYAVVAALYVVAVIAALRQVVGARRYLDADPVRPRS